MTPSSTLLLSGARPPDIERAAELLRSGAVVAFPTETVYGLGADAFNVGAVERVYRAKGRPADNPLIVHLADPGQIERCAVPDRRARLLAASLMPGPLTLVLPAHATVPEIVRAGLSTVAVRVPDHPIARALLERSGPLVAPSANRSGRPSPTRAEHVLADLEGVIAAVLDGGACRVGIESTVLDLSGAEPLLLRPGEVGREGIEEILGELVGVLDSHTSEAARRSPGTRHRHYAPSVPVRWVASLDLLSPSTASRMVLMPEPTVEIAGAAVHPLDAATLFSRFREAEAAGLAEIVVVADPASLPAGLVDRLRRASETDLGGEK